ncbi:MAG TPA: HAD family phosphatase [Geobacteraceae bacterium]|nr:HAD family phosphatase [Geobacteraceae bacterium]
MLNAVLFDFDGIIADTEPVHYRAYQEIFVPLGLGFSWDAYVSRYIGLDDREIFRRVFSADNHDPGSEQLKLLVSIKASIFQDIVLSGVEAYPGVVELIGDLSGKVPLALCSGAVRSDIMPILRRFDLLDAFDAIVTADNVNVSKPDPESYRMAVRELSGVHAGRKIIPGACLAIEDTPAGIASAKGAGIPVLAVTNSHPAEKLQDASIIVDSLRGLTLETLDNMIPVPLKYVSNCL